MRVESLLFKAETLYFVEVLASLERNDIVGGYTGYGLVRRVCGCEESQCRLSRNHLRGGKEEEEEEEETKEEEEEEETKEEEKEEV